MALTSPAGPMHRCSLDWMLTILLVAAAVRAGLLLQYRADLARDRDQYRAIATAIVNGQGFANPQTGQPTAYRPPLYPLLIAAILGCGGGELALGIVHLLLGLITVGLTIDCGRRLGLGRGSVLAGLLVAIDPILLFQTSQVMTETLAACLAATCLWLALRPATVARAAQLGMALGAACLCRPTFWPFCAASGLWWVYSQWRHHRQTSATGAEPAARATSPVTIALATLGWMAVLVAPWAIRNLLVIGRPIVTTTHGGYTLLLPHNPVYTRAVVEQPWGTVWDAESFDEWSAAVEQDLASQDPPLDHSLTDPRLEVPRDQYLNAQAWSYIRSEPFTALQAAGTLLGRMWSVVPATVAGESRSSVVRLTIALFYIPLFAALACGTVRCLRQRRAEWALPFLLIVSYSAVHALYWADMRMRAPLVPAIALLAAASGLAGRQSCPVEPPPHQSSPRS